MTRSFKIELTGTRRYLIPTEAGTEPEAIVDAYRQFREASLAQLEAWQDGESAELEHTDTNPR